MFNAAPKSLLKEGNELFRKKRYLEALAIYEKALLATPELHDVISTSIASAKRRLERQSVNQPINNLQYDVTSVSPESVSELSHSYPYENQTKNFQDHHAVEIQRAIFDQSWYVKTYHYKNDSSVDWMRYYNEIGWKKGEDPSPLFSTAEYLNTEAGLKEYFLSTNQSPLIHYSLAGHSENRSIFRNPMIPFQQRYSPSSSVIKFSNANSREFKASAAFIHCYYIDIAEVLIQKCLALNLPVYAAFVEGTNFQNIIEKFGDLIKFKIFPNRGRDIAPFVRGFSSEIREYEFALHLHTKRSLHYGTARSDWMGYCVESLLENTAKIQDLFHRHKDISIIFPEPPDFLKAQMNWGHNFNRVKALMEMLGHKLSVTDRLDFPAGSMFWFRTEDLRPIFDLKISTYLFECENGQVDGTLAHAYERLFGAYVLSTGKKMLPIRKAQSRFFEFDATKQKSAIGKISINKKGSENYNLALRHFYPELTPFSFRKADSSQPRINLLVPTVDPQHIFGGISTALEFYKSILLATGFDGRIITTDGAAVPLFLDRFPEYSCFTLHYCDDEDPLQILSGVPRSDGDMMLRENDVFIATSWWSAAHLKQISFQQKIFFGKEFEHIYLIQDFEPHFYGWSSKYQLADETYNNSWIKVYNTDLLYEYFVMRGKAAGQSYVLKPELNGKIKSELEKLDGTEKEKIVLIYGRPFAERNCNEILLEAISIWRACCPAAADWRVVSLGEQYSHVLHGELGIEVLGKVDLEEYAKLLARSSVGISLMVSPHPSYPPYEMIAAGLATYTNIYDNKLAICYANNLTMGAGNAADIAKFLEQKTSVENEFIGFNVATIAEANFGKGDKMFRVSENIAKEIIGKLV